MEDYEVPLIITIHLQEDILLPTNSSLRGFISRKAAMRLLGSNLSCGPLGMFLNWVNAIPQEKIDVVHLVSSSLNEQKLRHFLIFDQDIIVQNSKNQKIVEIIGYNAIQSDLEKIIKERIEKYGSNAKIGIIGLHLESTLLFLVYELVTRFGATNVSTCKHLDNSNSELLTDSALLQLKTIFKIKLFGSITAFQNHIFFDEELTIYRKSFQKSQLQTPELPENFSEHMDNLRKELIGLEKNEKEVVRYLYRGSSIYTLKPLNEGFGGCNVYRVKSKDWYNQENAVTVLKIGSLRAVSKEKLNFDRVASVLGNNAPAVVDYVEVGKKAGIKFSIASMSPDEEVNSFRKIFLDQNSSFKLIENTIRMTFETVLGRFYRASKREPIDLFEKYSFDGKGWNWKAGGTDPPHLIRERVEFLLGQNGNQKILEFPQIGSVRNVAEFMEKDLEGIKKNFLKIKPTSNVSFVHGDMNGNNILLDGNNNVWLIDFEYTCRDHILKDTLKLEADVCWEYTVIENIEEFKEAMIILKELLSIEDIGQELCKIPSGLKTPKFQKAWKTVRLLRKITSNIAGVDRSSLQLDIVMLRYALFMMTLEHLTKFNRLWCLAAACGYSEKIEQKMKKNEGIYIDWFDQKYVRNVKGKLGISILPGSRKNSLKNDILALKKDSVDVLVVLCSNLEMMWKYDRKEEMERETKLAKIKVIYYPIPDQGYPSLEHAGIITSNIAQILKDGLNVVVISVSGLGRCGIIVASLLLRLDGYTCEEVIDIVRKTRGNRAIENVIQENFVKKFYEEICKKLT